MKRLPALPVPVPVSLPLFPLRAERLSAPPTLLLSGSSPLPPPTPRPLLLHCLLLSLRLLLPLSLYPSWGLPGSPLWVMAKYLSALSW